jgi:uncharacterized protein (TIGR02246 family)
MTTRSEPDEMTPSTDEVAVAALYQKIIDGWNHHHAEAFAGAFAPDGEAIGFDGSRMTGRDVIAATLGQLFADHVTAPYVSKVKTIRLVSPDTAILSAIVGMVPPGAADLNPALNALQTVVASKRDGAWQAEIMQTTPAQFHGRPEEVERMTEELRHARLGQEGMSAAQGE